MADPTKAWERAFASGSKEMQGRLKKVHAKNPAFQSWLQSSGHAAGESVKQASKEVKQTVRAKQLASKSATAYGATKGLAVGGEHGGSGVSQKSGEVKIYTPAEIEAINKERGTMPVELSPEEERKNMIKAAVEKAAARKARSFDVPTLQQQHDDLRDVHDALHVKGVRVRASMDEEVEQVDEANMRFDPEAAARPKSSDVKNFLNRNKNRRAAAATKKYIRRMTKLGGLGPNQSKKDTEAHMKAHFEEVELEEGKYASTIAAIAAQAYEPKVGDKVRTRKGGQIPGKVEKIEGNRVFFRHPEGKLYATHSSNLMREEVEQIDEMDKSQPAAGRDSDTPFPKPKPVKLTDKQRAESKLMTKQLTALVKRRLKVKEEVEQVDESYNWDKLVRMHLKDARNSNNTRKQRKHAESMASRALEASKIADPEKAYRHYMGVGDRDNANEEVEQIDEIKIPVHLAMAAAKAVNSAIDDKVVAGIENSNARKLRPAAGDANITGRRKIIRNLQKRLHNLKRLPTYKNKEHPRHPETKQKVADTDAKIVQARSELEPHLKQQKQTTDKYNNAVDSDVRTYRNYGLVGLGLKRLKQKIVGEEVEQMYEEPKDAADKGEYDYEGDMAKSQLRSIMHNAKRMHDMLEDNTNLPEWVQSKITLAEDYISTAANYMQGEMSEAVEPKVATKVSIPTAAPRVDQFPATVPATKIKLPGKLKVLSPVVNAPVVQRTARRAATAARDWFTSLKQAKTTVPAKVPPKIDTKTMDPAAAALTVAAGVAGLATQVKPKPEVAVQTQTQTKTPTQTEPQVATVTVPKPAEVKPETQTQVKPKPETQTQTKTQTQTQTATSAGPPPPAGGKTKPGSPGSGKGGKLPPIPKPSMPGQTGMGKYYSGGRTSFMTGTTEYGEIPKYYQFEAKALPGLSNLPSVRKNKLARVKASKMSEDLDPVGKEDTDVNNDNKHNTPTDKYILNKRNKIGRAIQSMSNKKNGK